MSEPNKLLDKKALAKRHPALGARPHRIDWMVRAGMLPHVRLGRNVFFEEKAVDDWIEKHKIPGTK